MLEFSLRLANGRCVSLLRPAVMGVINASPESFYRPYSSDDLLKTTEKMVESGVDIIDVGGEATNPSVNLGEGPGIQEQIDRVAPVIEKIAREFPVLISVDTSQPAVMREAVARGAHIINDQQSLHVPGALATVVALETPVCLMHCFAAPRQPGSCRLDALLATVKADLGTVATRCKTAGISADRIMVDPGFGQGSYCKNAQENYYLLAHLNEFAALGFPVLVGWSRKSMIGETLGGVSPEQRLYGSVAAAVLGAMQGASIIRVHDVAETIDAMKVFRAMRDHSNSKE